MKTILLTAGDIDNGLAFQRGHLFMRLLKDKYKFICRNFDDLKHSDLLYTDLVVMFHPYSQGQMQFIHRAKSQYHVKVLVDLDDLVDNMPVDHPGYYDFKHGAMPDIIRLCDHLVVSTDYLKDTWGHLNERISVIENQIDRRRVAGFVKQPKPYHSGFVVGWTGSYSHRPDLYNTGFIKGLREFMRKRDDVRAYFHLLCPQTLLDEFGARIIYNDQPCDFLDYPSMCFTYPFDICAVPLYDHPFNHAKSDLRLLDMAPFRIPVVASNLTPFQSHSDRVVLTNNTPTDWYEAFAWCYEAPTRLSELADRAYDYVMESRTAEKSAEKWETLFKVYLG